MSDLDKEKGSPVTDIEPKVSTLSALESVLSDDILVKAALLSLIVGGDSQGKLITSVDYIDYLVMVYYSLKSNKTAYDLKIEVFLMGLRKSIVDEEILLATLRIEGQKIPEDYVTVKRRVSDKERELRKEMATNAFFKALYG